jgi:hypothetical protein
MISRFFSSGIAVLSERFGDGGPTLHVVEAPHAYSILEDL